MSAVSTRYRSEVPDLLQAFDAGKLIRPSFTVPSVVDVASAMFQWAEVEESPVTANSHPIVDAIGDTEHLVFVIVDGLGMNLIRQMAPGSFLPSQVYMELQTVWPSTTSAVLTSIATARWPNEHAIVGWDMYLNEIDAVATIIKYQRRSDGVPLGNLGVSPGQAYPLPSLFSSVKHDMISVVRDIADTPYSNYWTGNHPYIIYGKFDNGVRAVLERVEQVKGPAITHFYTSTIDWMAHEFGTDSPKTQNALKKLDVQLERLVKGLRGKAKLLLTADHGHLNGATQAIEFSDPLMNHLDHEPWGDMREMHFAVTPFRESIFEGMFSDRFGEIAYLITTEELEELCLMGPGLITPTARRRLGTHTAISKGSSAMKFMAPSLKRERHIHRSHHSGLTPDEMLVPLILA